MKFRTKRLLLASLSMDYLNEVHTVHSKPKVDEFNTLGIPANIEVTKQLMLRWLEMAEARPVGLYVFCIKLIETNEFIGLAGLRMGKPGYSSGEVWYKFDPLYWNRGYATEMLEQMLNFSFIQLQLHRVEAGCAVENIASIRVLEKAGFTREGRKRAILPVRGEWLDNYCYSILQNEYRNSNL